MFSDLRKMSEGDALATLCSAIKAGDVIEVNKVLSEDSVDVNGMTKDWYKSRPIILAASSGRDEKRNCMDSKKPFRCI